MTECRSCHRDLTVDVRTYSCFPNLCADCVDRRLEKDPDVAIDRELQARIAAGDVHRVELTPEQLEEVKSSYEVKSIGFDPLWAPITREDLLFALDKLANHFGREARFDIAQVLSMTTIELHTHWRKQTLEGPHG